MKIFIAGATGAVGKRLVPLLGANGYEVVGTTRSAGKVGGLRALGAEPVVLDVLDAEAVGRAVSEAGPDVVVHQATALSDLSNVRNLDEAFEETNRLRTVGTDNLLAAAKAAGARKFVAQSFAGWPYAKEGPAVKDEEAPLDPSPPASAVQTMAAIRHLETAVVGADAIEGIALRYGGFYGRVRRCSKVASTSRRFASARSRSSGAAPESGRSSTSTTSRAGRSPQSSAAGAVSTTSSTTSRRRRPSTPISPSCSVRNRPVTCRSGSGGSSPASRSSR